MKIFCDLDGTLIDVSKRHYHVYNEVVCSLGGVPLEKGIYWNLKRKKVKWNQLLPMSKLSSAIEAQFLDEFIKKIEAPEYLKLDTLFPGVTTTLDVLSTSYECYLVSLRRNEQNLLEELDWLKLAPHFVAVLSGHSENDGYDVKIELIKELHNEPDFIIGDTEADVVTGKRLGLTTIAVTSGIRDRQFLAELEPDYIASSFNDVVGLLKD